MRAPIIHWSLERTLQLLGFWPNKTSYIARFLLCSTVVTTLPFQLWNALKLADNPPMMMDGFRNFFTESLLLVKFFLMWYNQRYVFSLIEELAKDWKNIKLSGREEKMKKYVKYSYKFCICDYGLYLCAATSYYPESLISYIIKSAEERKLVLEAIYPFDYHHSPFFEIVTIVQSVQIALLVCADALSEMLLGTLVFHAGSQIDILVRDMAALSVVCNSISDRNFVIEITNIVKKHQKLIRMLKKIEAIYTYVCLVQFFSSTLVICVTGFVILSSMGADDLILLEKFVMFIVLMLWQAFAFCFAGEFLRTKSLSIPESIYNCSWYKLKAKNVKLLIIMLMRTQQPLQLTVGKFTDLSIGSFTKIVKTSASYLSVLRTMY